MSIHESLRTGVNDFGLGRREIGYQRMPVLNADQPTQIVALTPPDKRPSIEALNLMPPFDRFFIECTLPAGLQQHTTNYVTNLKDGGQSFLGEKMAELGLDIRVDHDAKYTDTPEEMRPKTHLVCQPYYIIKNPPKDVDPLCWSNFHIYIALGADGFPVQLTGATPAMLDTLFREYGIANWIGQDGEAYAVSVNHAGSAEQWAEAVKAGKVSLRTAHETASKYFATVLPLLYAINSLHNKRTVLSTVQHSRQVRRAAQRAGQTPPDQKTIIIKDFVTIMQGARKSQAQGNLHPLGETIGHWRHYGVDGRKGLLFGKYRGTFFVPSFLRGNPDNGATDHDYVLKVAAPKEEAAD